MKRVLQVLGIATPLLVGLAAPAQAQVTYPPETLSLALVSCELENLVMTVDGALPNSTLNILIDFDGVTDVTTSGKADSVGHFTGSYPVNPNAGPIIVVTISGFDYVPLVPGGAPFSRSFDVDRRTCPTLPETGSEALPIGRLALGATLGGGLLVVVAFRRRPRHAVTA